MAILFLLYYCNIIFGYQLCYNITVAHKERMIPIGLQNFLHIYPFKISKLVLEKFLLRPFIDVALLKLLVNQKL